MNDPMNDMMISFAQRIRRACPGCQVYVGPLPTGQGMSVNAQPLSVQPMLDGSELARLTLTLRCKHPDMQASLKNVWDAQRALTCGRERYPAGSAWRVISLCRADLPRLTHREPEGGWVAEGGVEGAVMLFRKP